MRIEIVEHRDIAALVYAVESRLRDTRFAWTIGCKSDPWEITVDHMGVWRMEAKGSG